MRKPPRRAQKRLPGVKLRDADKVKLIPVQVIPTAVQRKPAWIRAKSGDFVAVKRIKSILRANQLTSVCEEASCPNLAECFGGGTATFMIMGDICTRRCPFCDVGHGIPKPLDQEEPQKLAQVIAQLGLRYVVVTSVDRDDLRDGGAEHFATCIREIRQQNLGIQVEILTPDFRGRMQPALDILSETAPDVFNHNLETVPRLYRQARPGANYTWSLKLLREYKSYNVQVLSKSGLMVGLGESKGELLRVLEDMREHQIEMVTLGQYLQPSKQHLPVQRYVHPDEFDEYRDYAYSIGFKHVASGPLVRSSYHADRQAQGLTLPTN